jgi:hypothetical protein
MLQDAALCGALVEVLGPDAAAPPRRGRWGELPPADERLVAVIATLIGTVRLTR